MGLLLNLFGLLGNVCFGSACVPTAYNTWKAGKSVGTPASLAWMLAVGCIGAYVYFVGTYGWNSLVVPLGVVETGSWLTVLRYQYFPTANRFTYDPEVEDWTYRDSVRLARKVGELFEDGVTGDW